MSECFGVCIIPISFSSQAGTESPFFKLKLNYLANHASCSNSPAWRLCPYSAASLESAGLSQKKCPRWLGISAAEKPYHGPGCRYCGTYEMVFHLSKLVDPKFLIFFKDFYVRSYIFCKIFKKFWQIENPFRTFQTLPTE